MEKKESTIGLVLRVDTLFIELGASENSELTNQVLYVSIAVRITEKEDLTLSSIVKTILSIMSCSRKGYKHLSLGIDSLHLRLPMEAHQESAGSENM